MTDVPVACTLGPAALEARREQLLSRLTGLGTAREALDNGLRLRFARGDETLPVIARAIDTERRCCRFLHFQVTVHPDEGPIVRELTGPTGTRELLSARIAP